MDSIPFGKYLLTERLGEGGMAVIWRAKLLGPGGFEKVLVVKQIRPELAARPEFVEQFVAEAKLTVALTHANIVPVYELGMVDETYFMSLELVDGPPVHELLWPLGPSGPSPAARPLPPALAAFIVEQVLRGLDYAHRRGVVHRDLSSANVLVSRDGEVRIVDFGIAAPIEARASAGGSAGYSAPEQASGGTVDARSDLYSAGVLLGELCTGRGPPFDLDTLPGPLAVVVGRATLARPEERFADAQQMAEPLSRYLRVIEEPPTAAELAALVRRRCPDIPRQPSPPPERPEVPAGRPATRKIERLETASVSVRNSSSVTFATRGLEAQRAGLTIGPRTRRALVTAGGIALLLGAGALGALIHRSLAGAPAAPAAQDSALHVVVSPASAELRLDGKPVQAGTIRTTPGPHRLVARTARLGPVERIVTTRAGQLEYVFVDLSPSRR